MFSQVCLDVLFDQATSEFDHFSIQMSMSRKLSNEADHANPIVFGVILKCTACPKICQSEKAKILDIPVRLESLIAQFKVPENRTY